MGTRSLVNFVEDGDVITTIYRQYDGYPTGRGQELAGFLSGITMRNGFGRDDAAGTHANGLGCLAAQWVCHEKDGELGNVYLYPPGITDCGEEYVYTVEEDAGKLILTAAYDGGKVFFKGDPADFNGEALEGNEEAE